MTKKCIWDRTWYSKSNNLTKDKYYEVIEDAEKQKDGYYYIKNDIGNNCYYNYDIFEE